MTAILRTLLLGSALLAVSAFGQSGAVAVITHPSTPTSDLRRADLRRIFDGDRQFWASNLKIILLVPAPGSPERKVMLQNIYGKSEGQYTAYWVAKVFRNEATGVPRQISTYDLVVRFVRQNPGSLALVDAAMIPPGVRVLTIDGKSPSDPGYALVPKARGGD